MHELREIRFDCVQRVFSKYKCRCCGERDTENLHRGAREWKNFDFIAQSLDEVKFGVTVARPLSTFTSGTRLRTLHSLVHWFSLYSVLPEKMNTTFSRATAFDSLLFYVRSRSIQLGFSAKTNSKTPQKNKSQYGKKGPPPQFFFHAAWKEGFYPKPITPPPKQKK